jgi:hypothetical protein
MRLARIGLFLGAATLGTAPAHAAYFPEETVRVEVEPGLPFDPALERSVIAETEHYCMTLALFFEGGSTGESERGQRHIARVIVERAKANRRIWGGPTICGVVFHQAKGVCQFSFTCLPLSRRTPRRGPAWAASAAIARDALAGHYAETDNLIRYYMNADETPLKNVCRFRREFVPVAKAGRHEFFREPTATERKELARAEFEACTRYAALLEAEKAKAKKRTAKKGKSKQKIAKSAIKAKKGKPVARTRLARAKR